MNSSRVLALQINLMHSAGWLPADPGRVDVMIWLSGLKLGVRFDAGGTVVERQGRDGGLAARDIAINEDELAELHKLLRETGLPARNPRIAEILDTSDRWGRFELIAGCEDGSGHLRCDVYSSGYEGEDAPALKRFFARLLALAGVELKGAWSDLANQPD